MTSGNLLYCGFGGLRSSASLLLGEKPSGCGAQAYSRAVSASLFFRGAVSACRVAGFGHP